MGEKGWKAFIPLYNVYILLKRCSKVSYFGQMIIAGVVYSNVKIFFYLNVINAEAALSIVCNLIQLVVSICLLVLDINMMHGISKSFGHGGQALASDFGFSHTFSHLLSALESPNMSAILC